MQYPNLFKRIVPFALALVLGLFVASFFVSLTPSFKRGGKSRMFRQMKAEYQDLKLENERLKAEIEEMKQRELNCKEWDYKRFELYKEWDTPLVVPAPPAPNIDTKIEKRLKEKLEKLEKLK